MQNKIYNQQKLGSEKSKQAMSTVMTNLMNIERRSGVKIMYQVTVGVLLSKETSIVDYNFLR